MANIEIGIEGSIAQSITTASVGIEGGGFDSLQEVWVGLEDNSPYVYDFSGQTTQTVDDSDQIVRGAAYPIPASADYSTIYTGRLLDGPNNAGALYYFDNTWPIPEMRELLFERYIANDTHLRIVHGQQHSSLSGINTISIPFGTTYYTGVSGSHHFEGRVWPPS